MTPEEFRRHGYEVIDWIARYMERVEDLPVQPAVRPGEVLARLPAHAPEEGEPFADVLKDVDEVLVPGLLHWQSPNFFGFFPANASGPSILGELLSAGLGVQGMLWATGPACTELETRVLDWAADLLGLPASFRSDGAGGGVIQDSASSATLCALLAARERATAGGGNLRGETRGLTAYASGEAHSSVDKAVRIAGLGHDRLRKVATDADRALRPDALEEAVVRDRAAGLRPAFVCATVGTTSSLAVDPVRPIGEVCRRHGLWLHVDAAMAGTAAVCPEFRGMHDGLELADSYCFNPHKWMFVNFDCSCFYVADRGALTGALAILPEYLRNRATESGGVTDYRDWQVPLGRRFRALKLWFVLRCLGAAEIRRRVRAHVAWARELAGWVEAHPALELAGPARLNLVCFRLRAGDEANRELLDRLNDSGRLYLSGTKLDGKFTLRLCVGQANTGRRHVAAAWERIRRAADALAGGQGG